MLERLENRLRWLRLDEHRPQTLGVPISTSPLIMTEDDVKLHLNEILWRVNSIIEDDDLVHQDPNPSRGGDGRRGFPIWRGQCDGSGRPDHRLYEWKYDPDEFVKLHRMVEIKKMVHLRSIIKLLARRARQGEGFKLIVTEGGNTFLDDAACQDVTEGDKERMRRVLTQVKLPASHPR